MAQIEVINKRITELAKLLPNFEASCSTSILEGAALISKTFNSGLKVLICGNGGSAINFIMEIEKVSFVEAVAQLGNQLGIEIQFSGNDDSNQFFDKLYEIHDFAAELFHKTLFSDQGEKAKQYLLKSLLQNACIKMLIR